jgi:DNA-binding transcriptional MerR regulator
LFASPFDDPYYDYEKKGLLTDSNTGAKNHRYSAFESFILAFQLTSHAV